MPGARMWGYTIPNLPDDMLEKARAYFADPLANAALNFDAKAWLDAQREVEAEAEDRWFP